MSFLRRALDKLPVPGGVLLIVGVTALIIFALGTSNRDSVDGRQTDTEKRITRVSVSIESLKIRDTNLLNCIRSIAADRASIPPGDPGSIDDVRQLELLYCPGMGISDLAGIAALSNLSSIDISNNNVRSLSPLRDHPNIRALHVIGNPLRNIDIVSSLPSLREVYLPDLPAQSCQAIDQLLINLKSNFAEIECAGARYGKAEDAEVATKAPSRFTEQAQVADPDELTPEQQQELFKYEREARYRKH